MKPDEKLEEIAADGREPLEPVATSVAGGAISNVIAANPAAPAIAPEQLCAASRVLDHARLRSSLPKKNQ